MQEFDAQHQDIHLIEYWGSPTSITNNRDAYLTASVDFIRRAGFTIMEGTEDVYKFPDKGLTFEAILSESGITGHTWPNQPRRLSIIEGELDYANYLLHTCMVNPDFSRLGPIALETLQAKVVRVRQLFPVPPSNYSPFITTSVVRSITESRSV